MDVSCSSGANEPAVDSAIRAVGASDAKDGATRVSVGLSIIATVVGMVAGAAVAKLIHAAAPVFAWVTIIGLYGGLFVAALRATRSAPTSARVVALFALFALTFSYVMVVGGESVPRPTGRGTLSFFALVVMLLALTVGVAGQLLIKPFLPRALDLAGILSIVLPVVMLRGLYDTYVIRRHEAEADEFAVDTAGGQALIDALNVLGASGPGGALVHNRWTTHSTWERRVGRIREWEQSRRAG